MMRDNSQEQEDLECQENEIIYYNDAQKQIIQYALALTLENNKFSHEDEECLSLKEKVDAVLDNDEIVNFMESDTDIMYFLTNENSLVMGSLDCINIEKAGTILYKTFYYELSKILYRK